MDNLREAAQRIRATQNLMRARGMTEDGNYQELLMRLSTALAVTEAAYVEAKRRRELERESIPSRLLDYRSVTSVNKGY